MWGTVQNEKVMKALDDLRNKFAGMFTPCDAPHKDTTTTDWLRIDRAAAEIACAIFALLQSTYNAAQLMILLMNGFDTSVFAAEPDPSSDLHADDDEEGTVDPDILEVAPLDVQADLGLAEEDKAPVVTEFDAAALLVHTADREAMEKLLELDDVVPSAPAAPAAPEAAPAEPEAADVSVNPLKAVSDTEKIIFDHFELATKKGMTAWEFASKAAPLLHEARVILAPFGTHKLKMK